MFGSAAPRVRLVRFGPYEFDLRSGELRKFGIRVRLREQPAKILTLLLENAGEVVLRDEIRLLLWPSDTVVEFDHGINVAIQKLRDALSESADNPRYVETVARRGYRFIAEVTREVEQIESALAALPESPRELEPVPAPDRAREAEVRVAWVVAAFLAILLAFFLGTRIRFKPADLAVFRFSLLLPEGSAFGGMPGPALSPDGRRVVFTTLTKDGNRNWLRSMEITDAVPLPGADGGSMPFWSPNGRSIAFFSADGKLKRIDLEDPSGQTGPRTLCDAPTYAGGAWNRNGVILFANRAGDLFQVADTGGSPVRVTELDGAGQKTSCRFPWFLPDGRHFLFEANVNPSPVAHATIRVGSLDSSESKVVLGDSDSNAIFVQGRLLYARDTTLEAQPFDSKRLVTTGDPVHLAEQVEVYSGLGAFSAAQNGPLVYVNGPEASFELALFDRNGKRLAALGDPLNPGSYTSYPNFSPDGKTLAVDQTETKNADIWMYEMARGARTRFTFDTAKDVAPVWSPDGNSVAFASSRKGHFDLYRKPADGSNPEELLYTDGDDKFPASWSSDGKYLLFNRQSGKEPHYSLWVLPLTGQQPSGLRKPFPLLQTPVEENRGEFSPDGRWIAYESNQSGGAQVYVARSPVDAGPVSPARQISTSEARFPRWGKDGKEIFYYSRRRLVAATVTFKESAVRLGEERVVLDPGETTLLGYDISPDGQQFVVKLRIPRNALQPMTLVQNWMAALTK